MLDIKIAVKLQVSAIFRKKMRRVALQDKDETLLLDT
jgi:hypothetical protein